MKTVATTAKIATRRAKISKAPSGVRRGRKSRPILLDLSSLTFVFLDVVFLVAVFLAVCPVVRRAGLRALLPDVWPDVWPDVLPDALRLADTRARPPAAEGRVRPEAEFEDLALAICAAIFSCGASALGLRVAVLVTGLGGSAFALARLLAAFFVAAFFSTALLAAVFRRGAGPRLSDGGFPGILAMVR